MSEETISVQEKNLQKESEAATTLSPLRGTPPSQGESLERPNLEASATLKTHPSSLCSDATRGIRPPRGDVSQILHGAAKKAARSNSRNDVHEYMRIRRTFV